MTNPGEADQYLTQHDPVLAPLIAAIELPNLEGSEPWWELVDSIVSQQLSLKAAATILGRVEALFGHRPTPGELLEIDPDRLRSAGLVPEQSISGYT
jgi:DNA-3-methyladenine glycosylase II